MTSVSSGYYQSQSYGSLYRAGNSPALESAAIQTAGGGSQAAFVALQGVLDDRAGQESVAAPPSASESLMQTLQAHSAFAAQQLAQQQNQGSAAAGPQQGIEAGDEEDSESPAVKAFMEYMAKSTGEKFFERFLAGKGMTQEDFDALTPREQKALLQEFQAAMKQDLEQKTAEKLNKSQVAELF